MKNFLLLLLAVSLFACQVNVDDGTPSDIPFDGTCYRPVYASESETKKIEVLPAMALSEPGKIYFLNPYIFINEKGKGVHIVDNSDPRNPRNLSFISIPGNYDIAAKGTWLYADNASDLLVFDISNPVDPKLSKRIETAIPVTNYPSVTNVYFECADSKKGTVVGWEKIPMSARPNCYR
ncbi:hypothetical protein DYBT9275_01640 [Dyadobacter sp. CECT 9275]|uniref:LVIVD repeat-containing protein n=1 Tax=Dyadobacter helix TaxID=2822344 RepID=A0A916JAF3_9BACT|nr:hypothetical protein [Dyadobacter sp. CECT 9275]CAG4995447.1 hypothetical protein DYBT9275_01640 [Dyadobacter sp. CECT 9275]